MAQSTLRKAAQQMGEEGLGRIAEARNKMRSASPGQDRHKMVSRLLYEGHLYLHQGTALFWPERMEGKSSFPVHDLYF